MRPAQREPREPASWLLHQTGHDQDRNSNDQDCKRGRVKGTIHAVRVKLQDGGAVEGDIFHRSLSIDENSQFEGSSRRVENPTDPSSSVDAKGTQKKDRAPAPLPFRRRRIDRRETLGPAS
jgi:Polymer-forming cytoskeletal